MHRSLSRLLYGLCAALLVSALCVSCSRSNKRDDSNRPLTDADTDTPAVSTLPDAPPISSTETAEIPAPAEFPIRMDLFERVLELNRVQEPELDAEAVRSSFRELAQRARVQLRDAPSPLQKLTQLNRILLTDREVSYISRKYWRDSTLASSLLRMRGNCLSTSTLYFLVGHALHLPIKIVLVPEHAFIRWDDGQTRINVETVNGRVGFEDAEYEDHFSASPQEWKYYEFGRSGDTDVLMLELLRNVAGHLSGQSRQEEALEYLERAIRIKPMRHDLLLRRAQLRADITKDRAQFKRELYAIMRLPDLPSSMYATLLCSLADEQGAEGDHEAERDALMRAFPIAPQYMQDGILTQLAFCVRALRDFPRAAAYMELAVAYHRSDDDPARPSYLYNLAVHQKNDGRLKDALSSIDAGLACNPESWALRILKAGYTVLDGRAEEGLALFEQLKDEKPRGATEFYDIMIAWFYAASQQREKFYRAFEYALAQAKTPGILSWIDQDVDLDFYRSEEEFTRLVTEHKARLLGKQPVAAPSPENAGEPTEETGKLHAPATR